MRDSEINHFCFLATAMTWMDDHDDVPDSESDEHVEGLVRIFGDMDSDDLGAGLKAGSEHWRKLLQKGGGATSDAVYNGAMKSAKWIASNSDHSTKQLMWLYISKISTADGRIEGREYELNQDLQRMWGV